MKYLLIFSILFCQVGYSQQAIDINVQDEIIFVPGSVINIDANYITYLFPTDTIGNIDYWYAERVVNPLTIPTYLRPTDSTSIHPMIRDMAEFSKSNWLGYRYFIEYMPLDVDVLNENPSFAASNDLMTWVTPSPIENPITTKPLYATNSDGGWWFENDSMYLYYRTYKTNDTTQYVVLRASKDGITWTAAQDLLIDHYSVPLTASNHYVAPSILKAGSTYYMYVTDGMQPDGYGRFMKRLSSNSIRGPWVAADTLVYDITNTYLGEMLTIYPSNYWYVWHAEVKKINNQYLMCAFVRSDNGRYPGLYFAKSYDGIHFRFAKWPVFSLMHYSNTQSTELWGEWFYKPSFLPYHTASGLKIKILYSGVNAPGEDTPSYVAIADIKNITPVSFTTAGIVQTAAYLASVDSACALQGDYLLGDKFDRVLTDGWGNSTSGYTYTYGANTFRTNNTYGYISATTGSPKVFWDLAEDSTETSYFQYNTTMNTRFYIRFRHADTCLLYTPLNNALILRKGASDTYLKRSFNRSNYSSTAATADSVLVTIRVQGNKITIFENGVKCYDYTLTAANFADQTQMDRIMSSTMQGFFAQNTGMRVFNLKVKHLRKQ